MYSRGAVAFMACGVYEPTAVYRFAVYGLRLFIASLFMAYGCLSLRCLWPAAVYRFAVYGLRLFIASLFIASLFMACGCLSLRCLSPTAVYEPTAVYCFAVYGLRIGGLQHEPFPRDLWVRAVGLGHLVRMEFIPSMRPTTISRKEP
jgi:hypothetical protein